MKKITRLLFILACLGCAHLSEAQWTNASNTVHSGDAELTNSTPFYRAQVTGTVNSTSRGGLHFKSGSSTEGWLYFNNLNNGLYFGENLTEADALLSLDLDKPGVSTSANGFINLGPTNGAHLSSDGNEIQAKNGSTANSTLYLNYWGGNTQIATGNNTGDIFLGQGNDLYIDNSTGNIGIGTSAPNEEVDIVAGDIGMDEGRYLLWKNGTTEVARMGYTGTTQWMRSTEANSGIELDGETQVRFDVNSSTQMNIRTGAVGIGIGSAAASDLLHLGTGNLRMTNNNDIRWYNGTTNTGSLSHSTNGSFELEFNAAGADIRIDADDQIIFETDNANRMYIKENGRIGIGTSSPVSDMHIADAGEVAGLVIERTDQNNYMNLLSGSSGNSFYFARAKRFSIVPSSSITSTSPNTPNSLFMYGPSWGTPAQRGNTGIGTDAPTEKLHVAGNIRVNSTVITSDRRLKSDIEEFKYGLEEVKQLNPVHFTYNGRGATTAGSKHVGLIAQELQAIAPELVEEFTHVLYEYDEDGTQREVGSEQYLQIRDTEVKYMLMNSIKQMATENDELKAENEAIKSELDDVKDMLKEIQAQLKNIDGFTNGSAELNPIDATLVGDEKIASLSQNQPNPFNENTVIPYFIPENTVGAHMNIFSSTGKLLKTIQIDESGNGQINLRASGLPAGTYVYQLASADGVIGQKTMSLIK